jgi:hypothetical protein
MVGGTNQDTETTKAMSNRLKPIRPETAIERAAGQIIKAKAQWLDRCMKALLPPDIYELSKTGQREDLDTILAYLKKHKVEQVETPTKCMLVKKRGIDEDPEILSEFMVRWQGTRFDVLESRLPKPLEPLG